MMDDDVPLGAVLDSLAKSERHMRSEYGTGMQGVMDTVGRHPHFVMPIQPGKVSILSGREAIDEMYAGSVHNAVPKASRLLVQLATDWYVFIENVPTRFWIAQGRHVTAHTVTLFITDDAGGITGEFAWERHHRPAATSSAPSSGLPQARLKALADHERLLEAILAGDALALGELLEPACIWARRDYLSAIKGGAVSDLRSAGDAIERLLLWRAAFDPQRVTVVNRHVAEWYVFSEELWTLRSAAGVFQECRIATIYPIGPAGLFEGALGFGRELQDARRENDSRLGRAFWTEPGVAINEVATR